MAQKKEREDLLMKEAKEVTRSERLHMNWTPKTADEWIEFFENMKTVHADKKDVTYSIESSYSYGEEFHDLFVSYDELETAREVDKRLKFQERQEKWERKYYEKLKKKFGDKS